MGQFPELGKSKTPANTGESEQHTEPQAADIKMIDRSSQRWANVLGAFFSAGGIICLFALAVLAIFFTTIVADGGEVGMIPILIGMGATLILCMFVMEFAHVRSLAGYRQARTKNALRSKASVGVVLSLVFGMIHPLMGAAIPAGAFFGVVGQYILARVTKTEPLWDFLPQEAISVLSGRDTRGASLAGTRPDMHPLAGVISRSGSALSVVFALAAGSYLIGQEIMAMAAFVPLVMGSFWASEAIVDYAQVRFADRKVKLAPEATVKAGAAPEESAQQSGLNVHHLNVRDIHGLPLLSNVSFQVEPGTVTGIIGPSGSGKSLLLQAITDPFSLTGMEVSGAVRQSGTDLWLRRSAEQAVPAVLLPNAPVVLPASGAENLSCFHGGHMLTRGKWFLEQFVFASDMVEAICDHPNAQMLPSMQLRTLALSRAFLLGPQLYLMDRPEDGLPDKQIAALERQIDQETRMGRSVVLVTDKRPLLEQCDRLIVMQDGRIIDFGPAEEVRGRMQTGWARFVGLRELDTEDNLQNWVRAHFHREGDENNRRRVSMVAADLLALSCQTAHPTNPGHVSFMFKHFEGHCILRMHDRDTLISAGKMQLAREEADSESPDNKLTLLGSIVRGALDVEVGSERDERTIETKIETYDPRKGMPQSEPSHAETRS